MRSAATFRTNIKGRHCAIMERLKSQIVGKGTEKEENTRPRIHPKIIEKNQSAVRGERGNIPIRTNEIQRGTRRVYIAEGKKITRDVDKTDVSVIEGTDSRSLADVFGNVKGAIGVSQFNVRMTKKVGTRNDVKLLNRNENIGKYVNMPAVTVWVRFVHADIRMKTHKITPPTGIGETAKTPCNCTKGKSRLGNSKGQETKFATLYETRDRTPGSPNKVGMIALHQFAADKQPKYTFVYPLHVGLLYAMLSIKQA